MHTQKNCKIVLDPVHRMLRVLLLLLLLICSYVTFVPHPTCGSGALVQWWWCFACGTVVGVL